MKALLIILALFLSGCATTSNKMNSLSVGMNKEQVIRAMGQPDSTAAQHGVEVLKYNFYRPVMGGVFYDDTQPPSPYFVRLINGSVESFGEMGDFDSTKDPTFNINLNQNIGQTKTQAA